MKATPRAVLGRQGDWLGQAVELGPLLLVPLHVVDRSSLEQACLSDERGACEAIHTDRVIEEASWDVLGIVGPRTASSCTSARFASVCGEGVAVDVRAVDPSRPGTVSSRNTTVRESVHVVHYEYTTASGTTCVLSDIRVLFLGIRFEPGWSGAPVCLPGTGVILGFVHGNAEANGGLGVCLQPDRDSAVLQHVAAHHGTSCR